MEQDAFLGDLCALCGLNPVAWSFWKSSHGGKSVLRGERGLHGGRTDRENSRSGLRTGLPVNFSEALLALCNKTLFSVISVSLLLLFNLRVFVPVFLSKPLCRGEGVLSSEF
jgi:hypothetical protein